MSYTAAFGGRFVSEILTPHLQQLERTWDAQQDEILSTISAVAGDSIQRGRQIVKPAPALLELFPNGERIYLLQSNTAPFGTESWALAVCHALLARKTGRRSVIGVTAEGHFGLALAAACKALDLNCTLYMGNRDYKESAMDPLAYELGIPVEKIHTWAGHFEEACTEALRAYCGNAGDTYFAIGSPIGPAPYPAIAENVLSACAQVYLSHIKERFDVVVGSSGVEAFPAAILQKLGDCRLVLAESHTRGLTKGTDGVIHGMYSLLLRDEKGLVTRAEAGSAALRYNAALPSNAALYREKAIQPISVTEQEAAAVKKDASELLGHDIGETAAYTLAAAVKYAASNPEGKGKTLLIDLPTADRLIADCAGLFDNLSAGGGKKHA